MWGQEVAVLSLEEAVRSALGANPALKQSALQAMATQVDVEVAEELLKPSMQWQTQVDVGSEYWVPETIRRRQGSTGFNLRSVLPWGLVVEGDARYALQGIRSTTDVEDVTQEGTALTLSLKQPLLKGRGSAVTQAPVSAARDQYHLFLLQQEKAKTEVIVDVILGYRQLQQLRMQSKIQADLLSQAQKSLKDITLRIAVGRTPENDRIQAEFQVNRQEKSMYQALAASYRAERALKILIGLPKESALALEDFQVKDDHPLKAYDFYRDQALEHHPLIRQLHIQDRQVAQQKLLAKDALKWGLDLLGSAGMTVDRKTRYLAGIQWTVPMGQNKTRQQALVKAGLAEEAWSITRKEIQQQVEQAVENAWQLVQESEKERVLSTQALALARQSWLATEQKFSAGRAASFELVAIEQQWQEAEVNHVAAEIAAENAKTALEAASGVLLAHWES